MSCNICIEPFNNSTRSKITCEYCNYSDSCKSCWKQFLLSIPERARCMNDTCKKKWTNSNLVKQFDRVFIYKTYKTHIENIMYNQEQSLLPQTQLIIEKENTRLEYLKKIRELSREIDKVYEEIYQLDRKVPEKRQNVFIKKCPNTNCNGFLKNNWKCGICNTHVCNECHEIQYDEHKCDPNNVETVKLLKNDSKNCPKCASVIYRISGCAQMFCTSCNTSFDWNTLRIENGIIHNPHYFEWKRKQGTFFEDIVCGREIDHNFVINLDYKLKSQKRQMSLHISKYPELKDIYIEFSHICETIYIMCRNSIHFRYQTLRGIDDSTRIDNEDLRLRYLKNTIDEQKFKQQVQQRDKKKTRNEELSQILTMFLNAFTDIIFRLRGNKLFEYNYNLLENITFELLMEIYTFVMTIYNEINCLLEYTNNCLKELTHVYKCKEMFISKDFNFNRDATSK